jgi:integrase
MNITKRIGKNGKVSYRVLIRKKGFPPVSETFDIKARAEAWARKTEREMDQRIYVVDTKQSVGELFQRYHDQVSPHKPGARWEQLRIKLILRTAVFVHQTVGQVSYRDLQAWRDARLQQVSGATVRRELNLISSVFTHAMNEWHVAMLGNPVARVKRPENPKHRNRRVSQTELDNLWAHFDVHICNNRTYVPWMFEFAIETGMRLSEICNLRWDQVNTQEHWVYVVKSKNGDDRYVPLSERAIALLVGTRLANAKEMRVFPVNAGTVGVEFRAACKALGIIDLHFHDTRHEACSRLAKIYTVMELAKIIGHRSIKSLLVYYNPTAEELAQKMRPASPVGGNSPSPQHQPVPTAVCDQGASVAVAAVPANDSHIDERCSATG